MSREMVLNVYAKRTGIQRKACRRYAQSAGIALSREARGGMGEYIAESEVLRRALGTYGSVLQIVVTMEEMSELQKELCKNLRGRGSIEHIAEEIADVRRRKVERLKVRLDNGT